MAMWRRSDSVLDLTDEDVNDLAEREAQRYLGMTVQQFIAKVDAGDIPRHPIVGHLLLLIGAGSAR